jgi:hypothetical protein
MVEKSKIYLINDHVNEIIIGSLLSDGSIGHTNNGKNYFWTHTSINESYINYIMDDSQINLHKFLNPEKMFISKNKKVYKSKKSFTIKTMASVTFTKFYNKWYPNGKKIVPMDIILTPTILLHWYIGDGSISSSNGITLCTDSFDIDSIDFLLHQLSNLNLCPMLNYLENRIIIPNRRVVEFLNYIGNCPVDEFKYKWKTFIKESYIGRHCLNCNNIFDSLHNHQKYCNPKCAIRFSNKNRNKLKKIN